MEDNEYLNTALALHDAYRDNDLDAAREAVAILNTNSNDEFLHFVYNIMTENGEIFPNEVYGYVITNLNHIEDRAVKILSYEIFKINALDDLATKKQAAVTLFDTYLDTKQTFNALNLTQKSLLLKLALSLNLTEQINIIREWLQEK